MTKNFWLKSLTLFAAVCGIVIMVVAQQGQPGKSKQVYVDTPKKKIVNVDEAIQELDKAQAELDKTLKQKDWEKDFKEAMKEFDGEKIKLQIELALKQVDVAKIQADVQKALKEIDMEKMKAELQKIKEVDFKKMEEELKNIKPEIEKSLANARIEMENAKNELTAYKGFINDLEKDGLIDKNNYTIEYKKGELTVNGKKQPDNVVKKYSAFLKDRKDFTIKKNSEEFNIDKD